MNTGFLHACNVSATVMTRKLRRFAPIPSLSCRCVFWAAAGAGALSLGAGVYLGTILAFLHVSSEMLTAVVATICLIAGLSAGAVWPEIRASIVESRSWKPYAAMGVGVRAFVLGRNWLVKLMRLGILSVGAVSLLLAFNVTSSESGDIVTPEGFVLVLSMLLGTTACGAACSLLRLVSLMGRVKLLEALGVILPALAFGCVTIAWLFERGIRIFESASAGIFVTALRESAPSAPWVTACAGVCLLVVLFTFRRASKLTWADVQTRQDSIVERSGSHVLSVSAKRVGAEIVLLDWRRMIRSFEWRVRPGLFGIASMVMSALLLALVASQFFASSLVDFSGTPAGATVIGGIIAGYVLVLHSSFAPFLSLDSDRGAAMLLRSFPRGLSRVAGFRALLGALLVGGGGLIFLLILRAFLPIADRTLGTAAVSCLAISIAAPTLSCLVSILRPQGDWKEASEIGQRGWARITVIYTLGFVIALSIGFASNVDWTGAFVVVAMTSMVTVAPLVALSMTSILPTTRGVKRGA